MRDSKLGGMYEGSSRTRTGERWRRGGRGGQEDLLCLFAEFMFS